MLIEIVLSSAGGIIYKTVDKSMKLDEQTIKKYGKAFEKSQNAKLQVEAKKEYANKRLINVVNKKKAVINYSLPKFMDVYGKIQELQRSHKILTELVTINDEKRLNCIMTIPVSTLQGFTDKQLVCGVIFRGITGMMVKESEQKLSAAKNTMRYANVYEAQAKSIVEVYDAIIGRADRIADLLLKMNLLFLRSIDTTNEIIEKNGTNIKKYSKFDRETVINCVNIALAMTELIDIPVVDANGELTEESVMLIDKGQQNLEKLQAVL